MLDYDRYETLFPNGTYETKNRPLWPFTVPLSPGSQYPRIQRLGMIAKHMDVTARLNPVDALENVIVRAYRGYRVARAFGPLAADRQEVPERKTGHSGPPPVSDPRHDRYPMGTTR